MNINEYCYVKLTKYGKEIAEKESVFSVKILGFGWSEWQLWTLMNTFGKYHYMGNVHTCFENNEILFEKPSWLADVCNHGKHRPYCETCKQ